MLGEEHGSASIERPPENRGGPLTEEAKWKAVLARDGEFDEAFVFAVLSTGIYCRPSCPARRPSRERVLFFSGSGEAELSGFRPCRRCLPREQKVSSQAELVDQVCKYVNANLDSRLTLATLGVYVGLSPSNLQRTFKRILGISPRQYVEAYRVSKMKRYLRKGATVSNALYDAGFSSRSRVYENVTGRFGVNPGLYRRGGEGLHIQYTIVDSPLGRLLVAKTERGVCAVCIGDSDNAVERALAEDFPVAYRHRDDRGMLELTDAFSQYFTGENQAFNLPLDVRATAFQWRVWKKIQSIPFGETTTYSRIARSLGAPQSTRAVARACASNPVALVIPCHRVIGKDGHLHGYRWGVNRKQALLKAEQAAKQGMIQA